jgi:heme-degrading monooxygenase HmoA
LIEALATTRRLHLPMHLAQVNIALPREPLESRALAEFVGALEPVNELADRSPGFIWRLQTDEGDATGIRAFGDDRLIVNMSVWESLVALRAFVYSGEHLGVMRRRREWFEGMAEAFLALWWVPVGRIPSVGEAEERLDHLRRHGPTPHAFTFRQSFDPLTGHPGEDLPDLCPA